MKFGSTSVSIFLVLVLMVFTDKPPYAHSGALILMAAIVTVSMVGIIVIGMVNSQKIFTH